MKESDICNKCNVVLNNSNWKSYYQKRKYYICNECISIHLKNKYKNNKDYHNLNQANRLYKQRKSVIEKYGNKCNYCEESEYSKLTIDHVNGGGNKHRKLSNVIYELYSNQINEEYQILCYNCNCSKNILYIDKYNLKAKQLVLNHYGLFCRECGEDRIGRLTIDHIDNDGASQRKEFGCGTGSKFYKWLIKSEYPDNLNLQTLCFNCNCSKLNNKKRRSEERLIK